MAIRVVTFDFWGTLYENKISLKYERKDIIREALIQAGVTGVSDEMILQGMERVWAFWDVIWRTEHRTLTAGEFLLHLCRDLGAELPEALFGELTERLEQVVLGGNTQPIPGSVDAVAALSATRPLGVISDTGISSGRYLARLIARDHPARFSFGIYSDETGVSKPDLKVFTRVLEITGCEAHEVLHVGDLRHTDIAGAIAAGMHTVRFAGVRDDRTEGLPEADYVISDYGRLAAIVEEIG